MLKVIYSFVFVDILSFLVFNVILSDLFNRKSSASRLRKTNRLTSLLMQKERDKFLRIKDDSQPLANLR